MRVHATFTDIRDVRRTVDELAELGVTNVDVQPLAAVDPPLADPVLLTIESQAELEPIEDVLRHNGGSVVDVQDD